MSRGRSFLFLQGVCSPFFAKLADRLVAEGHRVCKVNYAGGDIAYWAPRPSCLFRRKAAELPPFLEEVYSRHSITDQILFGDRRPVHRPAVFLAAQNGIRTHVFEEGYFRPHWVTLEREGVNAHSRLPSDPAWYRDAARRLPASVMSVQFHSPFWIRAAHDVAYHTAGLLNPLLVPGYRIHAPVNAAVEYAAYIRHSIRRRRRAESDRIAVDTLIRRHEPFFLLPLQLNSDAQIRDHSAYRDMQEVIRTVIESFARAASPAARLVIKNHPLDSGLVPYGKLINALEREFDLAAGRVVFIETGDLVPLVRHAQGVVTVNSTVGLVALGQHCPTLALSPAVYNIPGLTAQMSLDDFWIAPPPPDAELFRSFRDVVLWTTQLNGGFYCRSGIALAVEHSHRRLIAERSPLEELL